MAEDVAAWATRAATLPAVLVHTTPPAVEASGEVLTDAARAGLTRVSGGDLVLSRVRSGKGAAVDVAVNVRGAGSAATATVNRVGPVSLVEDDTAAHQEPFRYLAERTGGARSYSMKRRRKAKRRGFLWIPGVGFRMRAKHPGTTGQHPIREALQSHGDEAGRAGLDVFATAVQRHLRG